MAAAQEIMSRESDTVPAPRRRRAPTADQAFVQMIERAAVNPAVDVDKLERLLAMRERMEARQARIAYSIALADMQPLLPVVEKRGRITINDKADKTKVLQSTAYALWEDINEAIRPLLKEHGFTLSFRTGVASDGKLMVTGILAHRAGHQEETTIALPHDSTGSKNAVQAVGSSTSYGKRYTAIDLLNLTFKGLDDDGKAAGAGDTLTDEQVQEIGLSLSANKIPVDKFLKVMKVDAITEIPAPRYEEAKGQIADVVAMRARKQGAQS